MSKILTLALKRAARKIEQSCKKTKPEVVRIAQRESTFSYRKALKMARTFGVVLNLKFIGDI